MCACNVPRGGRRGIARYRGAIIAAAVIRARVRARSGASDDIGLGASLSAIANK